MPHVLLAQSVIGDLDVTVEREKDVVELEIAAPALSVSLQNPGERGNENAPVHDPVLVEVLEREEDFGSVELGSSRRELLPLDVEHEISSRHVLHDKVDASFRLEARVEAEEERVAFARSGEEDALLRFRTARTIVRQSQPLDEEERRKEKNAPLDLVVLDNELLL